MMSEKARLTFSLILILIFVMSFACGCSSNNDKRNAKSANYEQINQDEAKKIMDTHDDCIILDVRTHEEYDVEHIKNAICIPNETITNEQPYDLPNLEQVILVYCRSGNRSKEAAQKLADMGYTNIKEFGGIETWKYDTE